MDQTLCLRRLARRAQTLTVVLVLLFALAAPAGASVTSEQQEGAQVQAAVREGKLKASALSSSQYERVGEYLMGQALGGTAAHERMNLLMSQMAGTAAVEQMHVYLGKRSLGENTKFPGRYAPMYGLIGMMAGYRGTSIATTMSGYLDGHGIGASSGATGMMGNYSAESSSHSTDGWPTGAIVAIVILSAALLMGMLARRVSVLRGRAAPTKTPVR